jgi:hypothetical protein
MYEHVEKPKENKSQSVANFSSQKSSGESAFQFMDNRPEVVAQRKLQEMANISPQAMQLKGKVNINDSETLENEADAMGQKAARIGATLQKKKDSSQQNAIFQKTQSSNRTVSQQQAIVQRKPTKKVSDKEIRAILARLEDVDTRNELYAVAGRLITDGSLWYDDSITETCAYPDPSRNIVMVTIPERLWFESKRGDATIERDAITYHELTHAAEVVANTGGDFSNLQGNEMDTTMIVLDPICDALFNRLEREKDDYEAVPIKIESEPWRNLYELSLARINYAQVLIRHSTGPSSREFPTIIVQLIHFIGTKAPDLKGGEFFKWLEILQIQARQNRESRNN